VIDDPEFAAVIQREWQARSESELRVSDQTATDLAADGALRSGADVVIFPPCWLGELVERDLIVPVPKLLLDSDQFARMDVFALVRQHELTWGNETYGVAFGSPQFVLLYRADLLEKLQKTPPATWGEYRQLAETLAESTELAETESVETGGWCGAAEPLAPGWAGKVLLARAAPYARHRSLYSTLFDFRTMEPLINRAPFVRALEELVAVAKLGPPDALELTPAAAAARVFEGRAGMALAWPARRSPAAIDDEQAQRFHVGFAALPGSIESYHFGEDRWEMRRDDDHPQVPLLGIDGRVGAIVRGTSNRRGAINLLGSLAGKQWSPEISPHSRHTTLFRHSQVPQAANWLGDGVSAEGTRQYAELLEEIQQRPSWLVSVRIPGQHEYVTALDQAVRDAVQGKQTPQESLDRAATEWRRITESRGVEAQKQAYHRSLGLEF
jgi:ABC-type glycerol-3-phosphate transport system substrate-binding protein